MDKKTICIAIMSISDKNTVNSLWSYLNLLDFGTFVSVCKYLLFLYSLNGDFDSAHFCTLELLFLYSNICYSLFKFLFNERSVLHFLFISVQFVVFKIFFNKRLCITISVHFFVFVRIQILNMLCFYLSEMASPSTPVNSILNHGEKPEKFNGTDFKRWQQKMLFYLTTLNLARFLNEDGPKLDIGETDKEKLAAVDAWNHSDFLCRNYVLNGLENTLYNVYSPLKTAKKL